MISSVFPSPHREVHLPYSPPLAGEGFGVGFKSAAKVLFFAHTAKLIAQNRPFCAHITLFVQSRKPQNDSYRSNCLS